MNKLDRFLEPMQQRLGEPLFGCVVIAIGVIIALPFSYGLALLHEPSSLWLWRDLLGLM